MLQIKCQLAYSPHLSKSDAYKVDGRAKSTNPCNFFTTIITWFSCEWDLCEESTELSCFLRTQKVSGYQVLITMRKVKWQSKRAFQVGSYFYMETLEPRVCLGGNWGNLQNGRREETSIWALCYGKQEQSSGWSIFLDEAHACLILAILSFPESNSLNPEAWVKFEHSVL